MFKLGFTISLLSQLDVSDPSSNNNLLLKIWTILKSTSKDNESEKHSGLQKSGHLNLLSLYNFLCYLQSI